MGTLSHRAAFAFVVVAVLTVIDPQGVDAQSRQPESRGTSARGEYIAFSVLTAAAPLSREQLDEFIASAGLKSVDTEADATTMSRLWALRAKDTCRRLASSWARAR